MNALSPVRTCILAGTLALFAVPTPGWTQTGSAVPKDAQQDTAKPRDGRHDFDFEFGSWTTHIRRLVNPLSNSDTWVDFHGTSVVRRVWNGRANLGELQVESATTHIEGLYKTKPTRSFSCGPSPTSRAAVR